MVQSTAKPSASNGNSANHPNQSWPQHQPPRILVMHTDPHHDAALRACRFLREEPNKCLDVTCRTKPEHFFKQDEVDSLGPAFCKTVLALILHDILRQLNDFNAQFNAARLHAGDIAGIWRVSQQSVEEAYDEITIARYGTKFLQHALWVVRSGAPSEAGKALEDYKAEEALKRTSSAATVVNGSEQPLRKGSLDTVGGSIEAVVDVQPQELTSAPDIDIKFGEGQSVTFSANPDFNHHSAIGNTITIPRPLPPIPELHAEEAPNARAATVASNHAVKSSDPASSVPFRDTGLRNSSRQSFSANGHPARIITSRYDSRVQDSGDARSYPRNTRAHTNIRDHPRGARHNYLTSPPLSMEGAMIPRQIISRHGELLPSEVPFMDQIHGLPRITSANIGPLAGMNAPVPVTVPPFTSMPDVHPSQVMFVPLPPTLLPPHVQQGLYPMANGDRSGLNFRPSYRTHDGNDERSSRLYHHNAATADRMRLDTNSRQSPRFDTDRRLSTRYDTDPQAPRRGSFRGRGGSRRGDSNGKSYPYDQEYGPGTVPEGPIFHPEPSPAFQNIMRGNSRGRRYKSGTFGFQRDDYPGRRDTDEDSSTASSWRRVDKISPMDFEEFTTRHPGDTYPSPDSFSRRQSAPNSTSTGHSADPLRQYDHGGEYPDTKVAHGSKSNRESKSNEPKSDRAKDKATAKIDRSKDWANKGNGAVKTAVVPSNDSTAIEPSSSHDVSDHDEFVNASIGISVASDDSHIGKFRKARKKRKEFTDPSQPSDTAHPLISEPLVPDTIRSTQPIVIDPYDYQQDPVEVPESYDHEDIKTESQEAESAAAAAAASNKSAGLGDNTMPQVTSGPSDVSILPAVILDEVIAEDRALGVVKAEYHSPDSTQTQDLADNSVAEDQPLSDAETSQTLMPDGFKDINEGLEDVIECDSPSSSEDSGAENLLQTITPQQTGDTIGSSTHDTQAQTPSAASSRSTKAKGPAQTEALHPFAAQKAKRNKEKAAAKTQRKKQSRTGSKASDPQRSSETGRSSMSVDPLAKVDAPRPSEESEVSAVMAEGRSAIPDFLQGTATPSSPLSVQLGDPSLDLTKLSAPHNAPTEKSDQQLGSLASISTSRARSGVAHEEVATSKSHDLTGDQSLDRLTTPAEVAFTEADRNATEQEAKATSDEGLAKNTTSRKKQKPRKKPAGTNKENDNTADAGPSTGPASKQ